jgi:hydrogenase maturation protease
MSDARRWLLVIGLGNPLRRDDGIGLRVTEELERIAARNPGALPGGTRLVAAGAPSLDLLEPIRAAAAVLLIDGVDRGARPGTVTVHRDEAVNAALGRGEVGELLVAARLTGDLPDALALVGVEVGSVDCGLGLSAPVESSLAEAVDAARRELAALATRAGERTGLGPRTPARAAQGAWA